MAIVQISKILQRSGNLVDLPQLDEAEFGWASDEKRLFIGKETPNENVEVLTSYSRIDFSQINGSIGNLNISNTVADGEVLVFDGTNWVNRGGSAGGYISLGDVNNLNIAGGAINYILSTDGLGNLSWTPKGALYTNILALSNTNPIVMTVANTTPYVNDAQVTITGVTGTNSSILNGETFYVRLAGDFATSGNVSLYAGSGETGPVNGTGLTYTNSPNAVATSLVGGSGGAGVVGGTIYSVQYNDGSSFQGDANLQWNFTTRVLSLNGNANVSNLNATGTVGASTLRSNVATGTPPLTVSSTTLVANLNADLLDGHNTSVAAAANTVTVRDANANVLANSVQTNRIFNGTSNVTMAASGNVTITVSGTERIRATSTGATITSNLSVGNIAATGTISASLLTGTLTTSAQPNVTTVGTLVNLDVTGNTTTGGIKTDNYYYANGTPISFAGTYGDSNVAAYLPTYTGNISAANVTTSSYVVRSVATGISAAGSVQGTATALSKDINVISTVSAGQGVRLPGAVAGMVLIVNNTSATNVNVYPATGAAIGSLATNASYTHVSGASLQYYAVSATQWYTVGATYA
jgi:hypothetical protein